MNEQEQLALMKKYAELVGYLKGLRRMFEANAWNTLAADVTRQLKELGEHK